MKKYHLGLDIGTSSVGFVAIDDDNNIIHKHGKNIIGARLFNEGQTAEERRVNRGARRRYGRRRWRMQLLNNIFEPYLNKVDNTFLQRMQESDVSPKDKNKKYYGSLLFPDITDSTYYASNQTIYHLRNRLMNSDEKADIREIYLALKHIVKYRGNFLDSTPVSSFQISNLHLEDIVYKVNELYEKLSINFKINLDNIDKIGKVLLDNKIKNMNKQKQIIKLLQVNSDMQDKTLQKAINKLNKNIATEIAKLVLGYKTDVKKLFNFENDDKIQICLSDESSEDQLANVLEILNETQGTILTELKTLYSRVRLNQIIPNGKSLSQSMIDKYNQHKEQLHILKNNVLNALPSNSDLKRNIKIIYAMYVGNFDSAEFKNDLKAVEDCLSDNVTDSNAKTEIKRLFKNERRVISRTVFYNSMLSLIGNPALYDNLKEVANSNLSGMDIEDFKESIKQSLNDDKISKLSKLINSMESTISKSSKYVNSSDMQNILDNTVSHPWGDNDEIKKTVMEIRQDIENDEYLPKQRTNQNGNLPHQVHQLEMDKIIDKQKQYYPFLAELNPNTKRQHIAKYKLDELVTFRVPYYVGPMITPEEQAKTSGANFAWMQRKAAGAITPWNFDEKVDRTKTANDFIKRMTVKDSYLLSEDVLPDNSLIYQEFKVLNELNMIKVNRHRLTNEQKQAIFNDLFKQHKNITVKKLQTYLMSVFHYPTTPTIAGLADEKKFNNSLSTYIDFTKILGGKVLEDDTTKNDLEKIIEWSTVFEDRNIFEDKLKTLTWLNDKQQKQLVNKRYSGWGRLSKRLLTNIVNDKGENILESLWNEPINFMQAVSNPTVKKQIDDINGQQLKSLGMESILDNAFTSPQNKKAIRQTIKVVEDIERVMGGKPSSVSIEFTRSPKDSSEISKTRFKTIDNLFKHLASEVSKQLKDELKDAKKRMGKLTDQYYLYFTQLGKDIYTGEPINIDNVPNYQIDHIIPQAFVKDNALSNRVLTSQKTNKDKGNNTPLQGLNISENVKQSWHKLAKMGLIPKRKLTNLCTTLDNVNKYARRGFIQRQLVETSQVIKLVANILGDRYNGDTKIIEVKAKMNSEMRNNFRLYKVRAVNDYHHALDAYLTAVVGRYLYQRYPKLRSYFVYDEHKQMDIEDLKDLKTFDFLHNLFDDKKFIKDNVNKKVILNRNALLENLRKIYKYKFMLVNHEVTTRKGALFDASLYSPKTGKKHLIPLKNGKNTDIYGGHSGEKAAYMALIEMTDKKQNKTYKFIGIPMRYAGKLKRLSNKDKQAYNALLNHIAKENVGKQIVNCRVLLDKVMYRQLIVDGDVKYTLGSAAYRYNAKQLVLSVESMKTLGDKEFVRNLSEDELSQRYVDVYKDIVETVNKYMPIYDINNVRDKLNKGIDKFIKLPNFSKDKKNKFNVINTILESVHNNPTYSDIKEIDIKTPLGKMQASNGIQVSPNARIYYQSPTGIFSYYVVVKDL
ncbi:type II CRISPR RNA-guided endonuclease Cas9 [Apilactobacillus ozensis]|uniref:type II CRISPR RNA-guided endonuclease Cas9 n=1 Tax=Apilactobacillus ozensis TaxID=866801 RepID=UPI002009E7F0|nr:type II CRISPR RNA-guided endonuclease Cas9 [Apilactobacillus ozensis]MCK8607145.1 type II CRISPR RNA-guided endonuclease Cas9 [Apilactobacillus ozensis]